MRKEEKKEARQFFQALFKETKGYIEVRTIDSGGKVRQYFYSTEDIDHLTRDLTDDDLPDFKDTNVYFGVCPRRERQGKEENVEEVNSLWVDLDCETMTEKLTALKKLEEFEFSPSIIVSSGNGLHCYWLLDRPYAIKTNKDRLDAKGYLKGLTLALGGDKTFDLSRILRVPGTKNLKNPHNPLPVEILEFHPTRRYELGDFEQYKVDIENLAIDVDISPDHIPDRFWRILEEDSKLKATWEGERPDLEDNSRSGYDMALADRLILYGFSSGEVAGILKATPYNRDKRLTKQYLSHTIGKAIPQKEEGIVGREERELARTEKSVNLNRVLDTFKKWLELEETDYIEAILATVLSNEIPGDPVWLFVVGPPGASKTEVLRSLNRLKDRVYSTSKLTPQSLISGKQTQDYDPSLLPKLNGKTLIIKDFTSILGMRSDQREIIFSDLREAYDGYLDKDFGNIGHRGYNSHFSLIANVTPVIDRYTSVQQTLGERFLKIRLKESEMDAKIAKAMDNENQQEEMRKELRDVIREFYSQKFNIEDTRFPDTVREKTVQLAKFVAICRTSVSRDQFRKNTLTYLPEFEIGTRLGIQLKKLGRSLACIRGKKETGEEEYRILRRIAEDTLPKKRRTLLDFLYQNSSKWLTTAEISKEVKIEYQTTRLVLEDLQVLGLAQTRKEEHQQGSPWSWRISHGIKELITKIRCN